MKMEEINNFQQELDETLYQAWEQFKELLIKCPQHYLTEIKEVILFYNELDVQTRQILDSKVVIPSKTAADAKVAIQEMVEYSQKWYNGTSRTRCIETSDGLAAIQAQLNNLGREIKKVNENVYAAKVGCDQCKGPHYTKYSPLKEEGKTLEEAYYTQFSGPFQGGRYRAAAPRFYQRNNTTPSEFYNSIMRDEVEHKGKNVVEAFKNVPIFVRKFSIVTHFVVIENMHGYQDQDMGDIILREPFCEARRFEGLITIHNGSDNMTYQITRSHLTFKHLSNAQCNKIKPLLKVSLHDKLNGISHPYQKLKSFNKGVLNLGPEYVRDTKMEEWLIRGHISVHEIE
ncbi:hypothetical protein Tco_1373994 [Tanacetum coccineum]